jgi:predicted outer membrane repeat protein
MNNTFTTGTAALGGAIATANLENRNDVDTLMISRNTFFNNQALAGGGVFIRGAFTPIVRDNLFDDNDAFAGAGLFSIEPIALINDTFTNNRATGAIGGAVTFLFEDDSIDIDAIVGAPIFGRAIPPTVSSTFAQTITECYFDGNRTTDAAGLGLDEVGAAVGFVGASLTVNNSTFINNDAEDGGKGGALFATSDWDAILGTGDLPTEIYINNSRFENNNADRDGGAIHVSGEVMDLYVDGSTFIGNHCVDDGGAIHAGIDANVWVTNSYFNGNSTDQSSGNEGGAIWSNGYLNIANCSFPNDSAYNGGSIWNNDTLIIADSDVDTNFAANNGGAIFFNGTYASLTNVNIRANRAVN